MSKKNKGQTKIVIYPDWCKGCGLCVAFCPCKVFQMSPLGKAEVVNESECINCGFCELHCPDFAIVVMPKNGEAQQPSSDQPQYQNGGA
jgi:2-oxoglutarate ferredoxin oxidoreductase subunit delta